MDKMVISQRLRNLRGNIPQKDVAKVTNIRQSALSNYENGLRIPNDAAKAKLAKYYNVTIDELFFAS